MFHKEYIVRYLIVSIILAVVLFCLEYFGGAAVGIIPMGDGGECSQALTLGGCFVTTIYSFGPAESAPPVQRIVTSHPILLIVTFILRLIIVIPMTNLFFGNKDDFDYTEELGMNNTPHH